MFLHRLKPFQSNPPSAEPQLCAWGWTDCAIKVWSAALLRLRTAESQRPRSHSHPLLCLVNPLSALTSSCLGMRYVPGLETLQHPSYHPSRTPPPPPPEETRIQTAPHYGFIGHVCVKSRRENSTSSTHFTLWCSSSWAGPESLGLDCLADLPTSLSATNKHSFNPTLHLKNASTKLSLQRSCALHLCFLTSIDRTPKLHCVNWQITDLWSWFQFGGVCSSITHRKFSTRDFDLWSCLGS